MSKLTFALYFGNRGFFPGESIASARTELCAAVKKAGYDYILMEESLTRYGAVETIAEGEKYAAFLRAHEGQYQGLIICLPNFGDENGAQAALRDIRVPVLLQACSDEVGKMDFAHRRDAFCGKIAMANVLRQCGIKFTHFRPFTTELSGEVFAGHIEKFAQVCRVANGMKRFNIAAIGARVTAFKTVRYDEIALQRHGINVESIDLSNLFARVRQIDGKRVKAKREQLLETVVFDGYPDEKLDTLAKVGLAIDDIVSEYSADAMAIRCWEELQKEFGIAPCLLLGEMNQRGIASGCELDVTNVILQRALALASDNAAMMLDINNNFGTSEDKCIAFHCGPVPLSLMEGKGHVEEHLMFKKSFGAGSGVGLNVGKLPAYDITFGGGKTEDGAIHAYICDGRFTDDKIEKGFFGMGAVMQTPRMGDVLDHVVNNGYRHHVCITKGRYADTVEEAFTKYLGYKTAKF